MPRYFTIKDGIECQKKIKRNILVVKRCRKIDTKKSVPIKDVLDSLGIRST